MKSMANSLFNGEILYALKEVYPAECVLKAAYTFLDEAYVHIDEDNQHWIVELEAKPGYSLGEKCLRKDFENELVAQSVRLSVFRRTHSLRKILLARAMSSSLIDEQDPLERIIKENNDMEPEIENIIKDWYDVHE